MDTQKNYLHLHNWWILVLAFPPVLAPIASGAPAPDTEDDYFYGEIEIIEDFNPLDSDSLLESSIAPTNYFEWKEGFTRRTGLNYLIEYAAIGQWGSRGMDRFHADHELNVIGMWDLVDNPETGKGMLMWWYQNSVTLGGTTTTELQNSLGALSPVSGGDTFPDQSANRLQLLAWEQKTPDEKSRIVAGKLTTRVIMNLNRYAVSDREDFFSPMIVNNPVASYTARLGLGVFGEHKTEDFYISGLFRDADAVDDFIDFDSPGSGNWEYAGEFGLTPEIDGLGTGVYRAMLYYSDAIQRGASILNSGWTYALSFDQDVGETLGLFARFSHAENPTRAFSQRAAFGTQIKDPFGHEDDRIGLGAWWGDPTDRSLRDETGIDLFWKLRVAKNVEFTPGVTLLIDPALRPTSDTAWVGSLRLRMEF